ncbi:MAG: hypothetical protein ACPGEG_07275 [Salibacteraceae bacterium]
MYTPFVFTAILTFCSFIFSENQTLTYSNDTLDIEYEMEKGKLNGLYSSFYKNGNKKAQGSFKNNLRAGIWVLWNKDGELVTKREYFPNGQYKSLLPAIKSESTLNLRRNANNYYDYKTIVEGNILWSKRIWRTIGTENNAELFKNKNFARALASGIKANQIHLYSPNDDEMKTEITQSSEEVIHILKDGEIVGLSIKEDAFFDKTTGTNETRIIALAPIYKNAEKEKLLCWFYYPEIRTTLAQSMLLKRHINSNIQTIEDLFYFRDFASTITKETNRNVQMQLTDMNNKEFKQAQMRIETNVLESEHDLWKGLVYGQYNTVD